MSDTAVPYANGLYTGAYNPNGGAGENGSTLVPYNNGFYAGGYDNSAPVIDASGGAYSAPAPDPYAQWGGAAQYHALVSGYDAQKTGLVNSAHSAADAGGQKYNQGILNFLDTLKSGQRNIDEQSVNNELAKKQGVASVTGSVGRGIRSSGVQLASRNAGNSSAAAALAGAYGQQGRQQLAGIGNQYALGQNKVNTMQAGLDDTEAAGVRNLGFDKNSVVNSIVSDAQSKLQDLDAQIAGASLPNRIAIDQEKENIRQYALQQLQQFDSELQQGRDTINPLSDDSRRQQAQDLYTKGTDLGAGAFNFTDQAPAEVQGTGPFSSELPLFSFRGRRQTA